MNYNPDADYIVSPGQRISLPPTADNPFKTFISANDVDENGQPVRFKMSHRTPKEIQFLVERKGVIQLAPPAKGGKRTAVQPEVGPPAE